MKLLIQTLEKTTQPNTIVYTANALGQVATLDARAALRKARSSSDPNKQAQGRQALLILYQRSPGMQYVYQAAQYEQQKDHKAAIELYDQAIKTDQELPNAYIGRGAVLNRIEKYAEALKDYDKAIELDDASILAYNGRANVKVRQNKYAEARLDFEKVMAQETANGEGISGVAICLAVEGKFEEGIKLAEEGRVKFPGNGLFLYNIACVYGRAVEKLLKDDKLPDREKKLESYRRKALDDLRASQKLGFNDQEWMQKDPDLTSLHDLPEFQELSGLKP